jgi:Uma2 family endonuclease
MSDLAELERPPTRRRIDVASYYRMAEAGILAADDHVELIDGEIIDMSPIGSAHAGIVDRLARAFASPFAAGIVHLGVQRPLRLGAHDEPQPDLVLLRPRADDYRTAHPGPEDVLLVIEVAASSLHFDRTTKLPLYARHAIPEVWIVDLVAAAIEVYREPRQGAYALEEWRDRGAVQPGLVPSVSVTAETLFGS